MKKSILCLILAATFLMVQAQEQNDRTAWKTQLSRHDIQFGISDPLIAGFITDNYTLCCRDCYFDASPAGWFTQADTYLGNTRTTGTLHIGYTYRVAKWCAVGGQITYAGFFCNAYDRATSDIYQRSTTHFITVMPVARFSWFNRPCVTMYSGLGIGVSIDNYILTSYKDDEISRINTMSQSTYSLALQATFFGIQAGRKWYGFAEIGAGTRGILTAGFGYHFVGKK